MRFRTAWISGVLGAATIVSGCGPKAPDVSPTKTVEAIRRLVETQTLGALWEEHMSLDRRKRIDRACRHTLEKSDKYKSMLDMGSKDLFVAMFPVVTGGDTSFGFRDVVAERIEGRRAAVTVSYAAGDAREFQLVSEDGQWRLDAIQGSEALGPVLAGAESVEGWTLR